MISESEARHSIMRAVPTTQTKAGRVKNLRLMRIMIEKWLSFLKKKTPSHTRKTDRVYFILNTLISQECVKLMFCLNILYYSMLGHKEFRFIYPVLPFCMVFCGKCFV